MSSVDQRVARGEATRTLILDAARDALRELGYAATTTRGVAERAGVQLSLVHYHYRRQGGAPARRPRPRERAAARAPASALRGRRRRSPTSGGRRAHTFRRTSAPATCGFSGSSGPPGSPTRCSRSAGATRSPGWRELLAGVAERWAAEHDLELPMSPRALATLVVNAFEGAEVELLAGVAQDEAPHHEALAAVGELIERIEAGSATSVGAHRAGTLAGRCRSTSSHSSRTRSHG